MVLAGLHDGGQQLLEAADGCLLAGFSGRFTIRMAVVGATHLACWHATCDMCTLHC